MGNPAAINWPLLGSGVGLRKEHIQDFLTRKSSVEWLEVITENFLDTRGLPFRSLEKLRQDYPVVCHGVSLSIASTDPLDWNYLRKLKDFFHHVEPALISDHLCFTGVDHENLYQLLPLPRTEEAVKHIAARIREVQDFLGQRMCFENISTYLDFSASVFSEGEFLRAIAEEADCGLLLDITNAYLNADNHGTVAEDFLRHLPAERIGQLHLAGHVDLGDYRFDSHSRPVPEEVWNLYEFALRHLGSRSTLIEWDTEIPELTVLESQAARAAEISRQIAKEKILERPTHAARDFAPAY